MKKVEPISPQEAKEKQIHQIHPDIIENVDVDVTVKRAPTDKSVQLLNEFQEAVKDNLIATVRIDDNNVKAICTYWNNANIEGDIQYVIRFTLNGKIHELKGKQNRWDWQNEMFKDFPHESKWPNVAIATMFYRRFSELISEELINQDKNFQQSIFNINI